jgi:hypothetical protein
MSVIGYDPDDLRGAVTADGGSCYWPLCFYNAAAYGTVIGGYGFITVIRYVELTVCI